MSYICERIYRDDNKDIYLECRAINKPSLFNKNVLGIEYDIVLQSDDTKIGYCDYRAGMNEELYYAGNIGYRIYEKYRGHSYAYQACLILLDIIKKEYNMDELIITTSPSNTASIVTIEKLGGVFIEECEVPRNHYLYKRGEYIKRIYRLR